MNRPTVHYEDDNDHNIHTESWAGRRAAVAERWSKMAAALGSPASAFEVAGAVAADAVTDLNVPPPNRTAYDRRALLNVIAVLLDVPREGDAMTENGRVFRLTWVIDRDSTLALRSPDTETAGEAG